MLCVAILFLSALSSYVFSHVSDEVVYVQPLDCTEVYIAKLEDGRCSFTGDGHFHQWHLYSKQDERYILSFKNDVVCDYHSLIFRGTPVGRTQIRVYRIIACTSEDS